MKTRVFFIIVLTIAFGCVHQEMIQSEGRQQEAILTVTRIRENIKLGWQSERGKMYSILYSVKISGLSQWKVLKGCERIMGNGEYLTFNDYAPVDEPRYYRIQVEAIK